MGGCFSSEKVLAILADCDSDIPVNLKEGVEELLYGRCSIHSTPCASSSGGSAPKRVPRRGLPAAAGTASSQQNQ
jgi:hypothetical protein